MASLVLWRRAATAVGVYGAAAVGILATVVAARQLPRADFGLLALVIATTSFVQLLLDLTVDEAMVKYGFRYIARGEHGRLRRLFRVGAVVKVAGGAGGTAVLLALAPLGDSIFGEHGLLVPLALAAPIPLVQSPEGLAATALLLRGWMDVRATFLLVSMALRLAGLGIGAAFGLREAVLGMTVAQVLATAAVGLAGRAAFRVYRGADPQPLGEDARGLRRFVLQSSVGTGLASARASLPAILVGLVAGATEVAFFRVAQAPQSAFASLSAPARLILLTEQTRDFEYGRIDRLRAMLSRYMLGTASVLVVLVPLLWWQMPRLVRIVYGARYEGAVDAVRLILVAAAIQVVWGWTKSFPVSIGRPVLRSIAQSIELVVLVPTLLVGGSLWGADGAAAAVVASSAVFAAVWTVLLVRLRRGMLAVAGPEEEFVAESIDEALLR
jgi:O-antigen/teichoic acid export membrane protein